MSRKLKVRAEAVADEQATEERLRTLAEMVVYGASRREVVQFAEQAWGLSRRTALEHLKVVQAQLARDAVVENRAFYLKLSQMQRDKLVGLALRYALDNREQLDPRIMQSLASLITAVRGLLDSRDRAAGEIHELAVDSLRNAGAENAKATPLEESAAAHLVAPEVQAPRRPEPAESETPSQPTPEANGRAKVAAPPTPLSPTGLERREALWQANPKSHGHKDMPPYTDNDGFQYPDCADCASGPAPDSAMLAAT